MEDELKCQAASNDDDDDDNDGGNNYDTGWLMILPLQLD